MAENRQSLEQVCRQPWEHAAGIAAICGPVSDDLICIDFDKQDNRRAVEAFLSIAGLDSSYEWVVDTPGGGTHIWLRCHTPHLDGKNKLDRKGRISGHIELRYARQLTTLPPSAHPNGGFYQFANVDFPTAPPAEVEPDSLQQAYDAVTKIQPKVSRPPRIRKSRVSAHNNSTLSEAYVNAALEGELDKLRQTRKGSRNTQLNQAAFAMGQLLDNGNLDRSEVEQALFDAACEIGLDEDEADATINSGLEAGRRSPREVPTRSLSLHQRMASIELLSADNQKSTWPYRLDGQGRMVHVRIMKGGVEELRPIADFGVRITEEISDEYGGKLFRLQGRTIYGRTLDTQIPAEDFEEARKLKMVLSNAADPQAVIYPRMAEHLAPAIKKLTTSEYETTRVYRRTGWADGRFLIPGREPAGIKLDLPPKLPYEIIEDGELHLGLETLDYLIRSVGPERSLPVLTTLFQAPLAKLTAWNNERYVLFIQGRTGSFKTSWSQVAMAIYSPALAYHDELLITLGDGATGNSLMSYATRAHDMPVLFDNYKPNTGGGKRELINLTHNILEGGEKDRLDRHANLRDAKPVYAWPVITGEDLLDNDPASMARMLVVRFEDLPQNTSELLSRAQKNAKHLNALGRGWLDSLESEPGKAIIQREASRFESLRSMYVDRLYRVRPDTINVRRIATNLATNHCTWFILCAHPELGKVLQPYQDAYERGLDFILQTMSNATAESLAANVFLSAIRELVSSERFFVAADPSLKSVYEDSDRCLGCYAPDGSVYLFASTARREVERLMGPTALGSISATALHKQLDSLGYLASKANDGLLSVASIRGKSTRVLHLTRKALEA